jgi:hypothetical protein
MTMDAKALTEIEAMKLPDGVGWTVKCPPGHEFDFYVYADEEDADWGSADIINALEEGEDESPYKPAPLYQHEFVAPLLDKAKAMAAQLRTLPCGHPAASLRDGACGWCADVRRGGEAGHRLYESIEQLKEQLLAAESDAAAMRKAFDDLVAESDGVAGLHLNGEVVPWADLCAGGRYEAWCGVFSHAPATTGKEVRS